jgi:hypothetical protein
VKLRKEGKYSFKRIRSLLNFSSHWKTERRFFDFFFLLYYSFFFGWNCTWVMNERGYIQSLPTLHPRLCREKNNIILYTYLLHSSISISLSFFFFTFSFYFFFFRFFILFACVFRQYQQFWHICYASVHLISYCAVHLLPGHCCCLLVLFLL